MSVFQCYTPTNDAEEEVKDSFYQQLQKEIIYCMLVIGDLNAKVGSDNVEREQVIGNNNGCGTMNEKGERMADFCGVNDLILGGTALKLRRYTRRHRFHQIGGLLKNQIDNVLI